MGFLNVSGETDIHKFPKTCEKPKYRESMGKSKFSEVMGFLNASGEADIHSIPKTWEK